MNKDKDGIAPDGPEVIAVVREAIENELWKDKLIRQAVSELRISEFSDDPEVLRQAIRGVIKGFEVAEQHIASRQPAADPGEGERLREDVS